MSRFTWKIANKKIEKAKKYNNSYQLAATIIELALWRNKIKYIKAKNIKKYLENDLFLDYGRYAWTSSARKMIKGEIGIDGKTLERIVVKEAK